MADEVTTHRVVRFRGDAVVVEDSLVVEEPIEIQLAGEPLAVVTHLPGQPGPGQ